MSIRQILSTILALVSLLVTEVAAFDSHEAFEREIKETLSAVDDGRLLELKVLYLSGDYGPWWNTGMHLNPGDEVTTIVRGRRWLSFEHGISFEPEFALWKRLGPGGEKFRGPRVQTFGAAKISTLELKLYPGVRWLNKKGDYDGEPAALNRDAGGGVSVAIVRWAPGTNVNANLGAVSAAYPQSKWIVAYAKQQQNENRRPPGGWSFLHELGPSTIWSEVLDPAGENAPARAIDARINNDVSIVTYPVDVPLTRDTTFNWKWKISDIPADMAENTSLSHDYLSIAVAFDNGQDLTYYWSRNLPIDSHYACPLEAWDFRETHVVARSGEADIGKWLAEEKNVMADYRRAVGGELPTRITGVWLIGVGIFKKVRGAGAFGDIEIRDGEIIERVY